MSLLINNPFSPSQFKYEENSSIFPKYQGDQLIVHVDSLTKDEIPHNDLNNDISLNYDENDYIEKFQSLIENNMRHSDLLKEHLHNLSEFLLSLKSKIENVELDQSNLLKQIESNHMENKELHKANSTLYNELKAISSTRLSNVNQYKFIINKQKIINQDLRSNLKVFLLKNKELTEQLSEKEIEIDNKDRQIKLLENKINNTKESIETEFKAYEDKIVELVKQFEIEKLKKIKSYREDFQEIKNKMIAKDKIISKLTKDHSKVKEKNEDLVHQIQTVTNSLNEKIRERESNTFKELNSKIHNMTTENSIISKKNEFLNQSIKDLLFQVRELQAQVKCIEPSQFLKHMQETYQLSNAFESINSQLTISKCNTNESEFPSTIPYSNTQHF